MTYNMGPFYETTLTFPHLMFVYQNKPDEHSITFGCYDEKCHQGEGTLQVPGFVVISQRHQIPLHHVMKGKAHGHSIDQATIHENVNHRVVQQKTANLQKRCTEWVRTVLRQGTRT